MKNNPAFGSVNTEMSDSGHRSDLKEMKRLMKGIVFVAGLIATLNQAWGNNGHLLLENPRIWKTSCWVTDIRN